MYVIMLYLHIYATSVWLQLGTKQMCSEEAALRGESVDSGGDFFIISLSFASKSFYFDVSR